MTDFPGLEETDDSDDTDDATPLTAGAGELRSLPVPDGLAGERIDAGLSRLLGLSRTKVADIVENGGVTVDGVVAAKSHRLVAGTWLEVQLPAAARPAVVIDPQPVPGMDILFEDDDVVVVNKPVGVAAHPSPGWTGPTVIGGLAATGRRISTSGAAERQGVVHRLDVGTTGAMVVAKSEAAYSSLKHQFKERTVAKTYLAIVQGLLDPLRGTVDAPIDRHPSNDWKFAVVAGGKPSITHYDTVEAFRHASLVEVDLETGRTHQIRVHMNAIKHPIVGDITYGADPILAEKLGLKRQWLHAARLAFDHPTTGQRIDVEAPLPADLQIAVDRLREGVKLAGY
jgi:23S rRNA pseudouridine1911/1915/1917 synthase